MILFEKKLAGAALVLALASSVSAQASDPSNNPEIKAYAKQTETKTVEQALPSDLLVYDLNNDGVLQADEVGEKLFYQYDTDGNEVLDNIEFRRPLNLSFAPVETTKTVTVTVDYGDGTVTDMAEVDKDVVMRETGLDRFNKDGDEGVSPREFIGKSFLNLDLNDSGVIEMNEWTNAYDMNRAPLAANNTIYND
jgi:hypothetical protein